MLPNLGGAADVCLTGLVELIRIMKVKLLLTVTTMKNILQMSKYMHIILMETKSLMYLAS